MRNLCLHRDGLTSVLSLSIKYEVKMALLDEVKVILGDVLQLGDKVDGYTASTRILGEIPEFDSMAVVTTITAIEETYGFVVDDDEIDADTFETLGSLTDFVASKL